MNKADSIFIMILMLVLAASVAMANEGETGPGICNPDIEICDPPCPPGDPTCDIPEPSELELLLQLAASCEQGDISRYELRIYNSILINSVRDREIRPRDARRVHRAILNCI